MFQLNFSHNMRKLPSNTFKIRNFRTLIVLPARGFRLSATHREFQIRFIHHKDACYSSRRSISNLVNGLSATSIEGYDISHEECNVPAHIASRVGANIHLQSNHPLNIIKNLIEKYWQERGHGSFAILDNLSPVVSTFENFDSLLIPKDHISRTKSDTYYIRHDIMLRTHTSAHQTNVLRAGLNKFLVMGDVYRRDEIDSTHYPIFHQCEGVKIFTEDELHQAKNEEERLDLVVTDLKTGLEGMVRCLFGDVQVRWVDTYFPFTTPSFELEIFFQGAWLEVLGCGIVHKDILASVGRNGQLGWAFGLGLERLAMVLFSIPDIRLFWSTDDRFRKQFESGKIVKFQSFSKYPPCIKDLSFWTTDFFHPNDLNEVVRSTAGDLVEKVELIDEFIHPKSKRISNCFRISYRCMERSLTNDEIDQLQDRVRNEVVAKLKVELR